MSDFDDFDNGQISQKLTQKYHLVFSSLKTEKILKMPNETFFKITQYLSNEINRGRISLSLTFFWRAWKTRKRRLDGFC